MIQIPIDYEQGSEFLLHAGSDTYQLRLRVGDKFVSLTPPGSSLDEIDAALFNLKNGLEMIDTFVKGRKELKDA